MRKTVLAIGLVAAGATAAFLLTRHAAPTRVAAKAPHPPVPSIKDPPALRRFVEAHAAAKDPETRDRVGAAEVRLGYAVARSEGYAKARPIFLATARAHEGVGAQSAAFGGVADQAAYQAVACLAGEGRKDEARKGFEAYLRERPLSPLVHAAYRRLARLNGGESTPEWDRMLQADVAKQEARVRFETSVCGPKCLEYLLQTPSLPSPGGQGIRKSSPLGEGRVGVPASARSDYKALARLCGTTDAGTTVAGMRRGLLALGHESWAARLDRRDLARAPLPAVLLQGDHYVVLTKIEGENATVWDPRFAAPTPWRLPPLDDPDFSATAILLSKPEGVR